MSKHCVFILLSLLLGGYCAAQSPVERVDPMIGTGGKGHAYPGATTPFGMVQLSPSNDFSSWKRCAGYHYDDDVIKGFAHTHISGAGLSGLGDILFMPAGGELQLSAGTDENPDGGYRSRFSHDSERAAPGYYAVLLSDEDIFVELTATPRVGVHRYTFRRGGVGRIMIDPSHNLMERVEGISVAVIDSVTVVGFKRVGEGVAGARTVYFHARFSRPFDRFRETDDADDPIGYVEYRDLKPGERIGVQVGISFVGAEGAGRNLEAEAAGRSFDELRKQAREAWERQLSRIGLEGASDREATIFYTALYHASLSPNLISDVDGAYCVEGRRLHSPFPQYSNFSAWDTYRAQHPLLLLTAPAQSADMVNSLVSRHTVAGLELPVWECLGHDNICMIGYSTVPILADAILKGVPGIDVEGAYRAMCHAATSNDKHSQTYGPCGMDHYLRWNFVPAEIGCSVSKTTEYNYYDWTISRVARFLGRRGEARRFEARSAGYRNLFSPDDGYLYPRSTTGFLSSPDTTRWAPLIRNYISGNLWGYSTYAPHDVTELIALHGGDAAFVAFLDRLFHTEVSIEGEQHVDISGFLGHYGHGDEPSHHMPYLYAYAGAPYKACPVIREILKTQYDTTPEGLVNNDDLGQLSAWYVFSSLGFYPVCPGDMRYIIGSPLFDRATLHLGDGVCFTVRTVNNSERNCYVRRAWLNGRPYGKSYIAHEQLMRGGELVLEMGDTPDPQWGHAASDRPVARVDRRLGGESRHTPCHSVYDEQGEWFFSGRKTVRLRCETPQAAIRYTLDGSIPTASSPLYDAERGIPLEGDATLCAVAFRRGRLPSDPFVAHYVETPMAALPEGYPRIELRDPTSTYGAPDGSELIDGRWGAIEFSEGGWSGFAGRACDLDAVIDMGRSLTLSELMVGYLVNTDVWIFPPGRIRLWAGDDPERLTPLEVGYDPLRLDAGQKRLYRPTLGFDARSARYWRIRIENYGPIPSWHGGAGSIPYLFVDEILFR